MPPKPGCRPAADRRRTHRRHGRLHVAGAGGREACRSAVGCVLARRHPLRDGDGGAPVQGRHAICRSCRRSSRTRRRPITEVRRGLPRELSKIINRCLAKDVEDRYQTAKDLRNDLRALKNELTSGEIVPITGSSIRPTMVPMRSVSARRFRGRMRAIAVVVLAIAAALVSAAVALRRAPRTAARRPRVRSMPSTLTRLTTTGTARPGAMSADGRYVAHVSAKGGQQSLWLRQVATTSNVEIVPPAEVRYIGVAFSPDGNHIYYATYGAARTSACCTRSRCSAAARASILEDVDTAVSFSPDGKAVRLHPRLSGRGQERRHRGERPTAASSALIATRKRPLRFPAAGDRMVPGRQDDRRHRGTRGQLRGEIVVGRRRDRTETCWRRRIGGR